MILGLFSAVVAIAGSIQAGTISRGIGSDRPILDAAIGQFLSSSGAPGCAFAIVKNGRITYSRGYGSGDKSRNEPFTPKSVFRLASLTKTLTSFSILKLIEGQKLKLSDRIFKVLETKPFPPNAQIDSRLLELTVEQCLNMTGGWEESSDRYRLLEMCEIAKANHLEFPYDSETSARMLLGMGLKFEPGTRQIYSNEGYVLLGRVIEKLTGLSYIDCVRKYTGIKGLQTARTRAEDRFPGEVTYYGEEPRRGRSRWDADKGKIVDWEYGAGPPMESLGGCGGLICTVEDYAFFVARLSDPGSSILKPESWSKVSAVPKCLAGTKPSQWYGLGWFIFPEGNHYNFVHGGVLRSACCKVNSRPDGQTLIIFCNYNNKELNLHDKFMTVLHKAANEENRKTNSNNSAASRSR